eukprot:3873227-Prymnesium_polylepis.1
MTTSAWVKGPSLGIARVSLGGASLGHRLYAVGGIYGQKNALKSIEYLDPSAPAWLPGPSASVTLSVFLLVAQGTMLYTIGASVQLFDTLSGVWRTGPDLLNAPLSPGGGAIDGCVYAVGGYSGDDDLKGLNTTDTETWAFSRGGTGGPGPHHVRPAKCAKKGYLNYGKWTGLITQ